MTTQLVNSETVFKNLHQDLIEGCKNGDQKAQFRIYRLYYKAMYNTSLRIVANVMEAEDIMQESFLSAFEKIDTYSGTVSFGAWLKKIVINRSLDYLEKSRRLIFEDIDSFSGIADDGEDEMAQDEELHVRAAELTEAVKRLPDKSRIILTLYLLEGYDHEEISEILSITSSTSRSQLSRAKRKLIEELKEKLVMTSERRV
jgi:RNA polymerase sigma factor (sigma-70 family)